jgi:hypothetical protein
MDGGRKGGMDGLIDRWAEMAGIAAPSSSQDRTSGRQGMSWLWITNF